jgi:hypothetical protein
MAAGSAQASDRRRAPGFTPVRNSGLPTTMERPAADRTAAVGAGFDRGAGTSTSSELVIPLFCRVSGARGSNIGFHARCKVVPAVATGGARRRLTSMDHRAAMAGPSTAERGVRAQPVKEGAAVDRMTVTARTSPGFRGAGLGASGANPACGCSAGAWRSGTIHSGPIDAPGMRGRSPANGKSPRPVAGVRAGDRSAAAVSPANPE